MRLFYTILYIQHDIENTPFYNNPFNLIPKSEKKESEKKYSEKENHPSSKKRSYSNYTDNTELCSLNTFLPSLFLGLFFQYISICISKEDENEDIYQKPIKNTIKNTIKKNIKNKYKWFEQIILQNTFLLDSQKELFILEFGKAQRIYFVLNRFLFLYKYKKSRKPIQTDLFLNPIDDSKNNIITIYQAKTRYLFTISDLLRIIQNALFYSPYKLESEPIIPKNPYNNIKFNYSHFFHLYLHLKTKCMYTPIPLYFELFYKSEFDVNDFAIHNDFYIQKHIIKEYIFNKVTYLDKEVMLNLKYMLSEHSYARKLKMNTEFPKSELLDIFRPYLYLYYLVWYSNCDDTQSLFYKSSLLLLLSEFYKTNPNFGKMTVYLEKVYEPDPVTGIQKIVSPYILFPKRTYHSNRMETDDFDNLESNTSYVSSSNHYSSTDSLTIIPIEEIERINNENKIKMNTTKSNRFEWKNKDEPIKYKIIRKTTFNKYHKECNTRNY